MALLVEYVITAVVLIIVAWLFAWVMWVLFIMYVLDWHGAHTVIPVVTGVVLVGGAGVWLRRRA